VFLLAEQLFQPDGGGQQEGEFAEEQSFSNEQGESLESYDLEDSHFHHHGRHHGSHVLVLAPS